MDTESTTPETTPVAEGQLSIDETPAIETTTPEPDHIARSWQARAHLHFSEATDFNSLPTVEEFTAAVQWALETKLGGPDRHWTISAEIV